MPSTIYGTVTYHSVQKIQSWYTISITIFIFLFILIACISTTFLLPRDEGVVAKTLKKRKVCCIKINYWIIVVVTMMSLKTELVKSKPIQIGGHTAPVQVSCSLFCTFALLHYMYSRKWHDRGSYRCAYTASSLNNRSTSAYCNALLELFKIINCSLLI